MFNMIYSRLLAGEDADSIAQDFTNFMNAAQARYTDFQKQEEARAAKEAEEKARKESEEAERQKEQSTKITIMTGMLRVLVDYVDRYYPYLLEGEEITESDLKAMAGAIVDMLDRMAEPKPKWCVDPLDLMKMFWL